VCGCLLIQLEIDYPLSLFFFSLSSRFISPLSVFLSHFFHFSSHVFSSLISPKFLRFLLSSLSSSPFLISSILFYSYPLDSILFYSFLFHSLLSYSILSYSVLAVSCRGGTTCPRSPTEVQSRGMAFALSSLLYCLCTSDVQYFNNLSTFDCFLSNC
jgi:hypothetical protein